MICAMGAITILGFIVWAQLGLLICKYKVIKLRYMLETFLNISSINIKLYWKMLITYLYGKQSAGNKSTIKATGDGRQSRMLKHSWLVSPKNLLFYLLLAHLIYNLTNFINYAITIDCIYCDIGIITTPADTSNGAVQYLLSSTQIQPSLRILLEGGNSWSTCSTNLSKKYNKTQRQSRMLNILDWLVHQALRLGWILYYDKISSSYSNSLGSYGFIGSSETTREVSIKLNRDSVKRDKLALQSQSATLNPAPPWFIEWFIGFSEGEGSFIVDESNKRLFFKIRHKDAKVLYLIRSYFGFGSISADSDGYFSYSVQAQSDIKKLIQMFNGNLVLFKTNYRFYSNWLTHYNMWNNSVILYKGQASFLGFDNAWLLGFSEADGSLGFKLINDKQRSITDNKRLRVYWYIDQTNEQDVLLIIKKVLGFGRLEKKKQSDSSFSSNDTYRLITDSFKNCNILLVYFNKYKPLTNKFNIRFIRWARVLKWADQGIWFSYYDSIKHLIYLNKKLN